MKLLRLPPHLTSVCCLCWQYQGYWTDGEKAPPFLKNQQGPGTRHSSGGDSGEPATLGQSRSRRYRHQTPPPPFRHPTPRPLTHTGTRHPAP